MVLELAITNMLLMDVDDIQFYISLSKSPCDAAEVLSHCLSTVVKWLNSEQTEGESRQDEK